MKRFAQIVTTKSILKIRHACRASREIGYLVPYSIRSAAAPIDATAMASAIHYVRCSNFLAIGCNWFADDTFSGSAAVASTRARSRICLLTAIRNAGSPWRRPNAASTPSTALVSHRTTVGRYLQISGLNSRPTRLRLREAVLTGHDRGLITLDVVPEREKHRTGMGGPYRTLIGRFRHEIGHLYWDPCGCK